MGNRDMGPGGGDDACKQGEVEGEGGGGGSE